MSDRAGERPRGRELTTRALRTSRSWSGRALLVAFGVGLGVAASVAVTDSPTEVQTVAADDPSVQGFRVEPGADGGDDGGPGVRYVTEGGTQASGSDGSAGEAGGPAAGSGGSGAAIDPGEFECKAGENGGSTDTGVSGNSIKVAANVVEDGVGKSFLEEAKIGIQAVFDAVNVKGICGRKIVFDTLNDSWDASKGARNIENWINQGYFAIAVNPSSEGLNQATETGIIADAGIPVVGTDGMLISQYRLHKGGRDLASWIWPVAASTISTMHIMAQHGVDEGAKTFGLAWDGRYKFGTEGRNAFINHLKSLGVSGSNIYDLEIQPGQNVYTNEANTFNNGCAALPGGACDMVAMLLDTSTAVTWIKANATFGRLLTSGPQTLFNDAFATNCEAERKKLPGNKHCEMIVWTGYNPPVGALSQLPDVQEFVASVKARNGQADTSNSFTQGAYIGAKVFVEALQKVGPDLTRANLRAVLDSMTFSSDLLNPDRPLKWSEGNHFSNTTMQAFEITYTAQQGFNGWARASDWLADTRVGQE